LFQGQNWKIFIKKKNLLLSADHIEAYYADDNLNYFAGFVAIYSAEKQILRAIWYVTRWNGHTDVLSVVLISNDQQVSQIT